MSRRGVRWTLAAVGAAAVALATLELTERETSEDATAGKQEPARVEPIEGTSLKRVRLSAGAVGRLGLQTTQVGPRGTSRLSIVPYAALLYDERGKTWVYVRDGRSSFVRSGVRINVIRGDKATLSSGPPVGAEVVSVGAAELYGAELGVDH